MSGKGKKGKAKGKGKGKGKGEKETSRPGTQDADGASVEDLRAQVFCLFGLFVFLKFRDKQIRDVKEGLKKEQEERNYFQLERVRSTLFILINSPSRSPLFP